MTKNKLTRYNLFLIIKTENYFFFKEPKYLVLLVCINIFCNAALPKNVSMIPYQQLYNSMV